MLLLCFKKLKLTIKLCAPTLQFAVNFCTLFLKFSRLLHHPQLQGFFFSNPLAGLQAWCGDPQDWLNSIVNLSAYAGQTVQFRFRLGSDNGVSREGWTIDDVVVQSCQAACPYNVNGTGGVDIVDIQLVAGAFGTNTPAYDFDIDGTVDVDDIVAVAQRWIVGCQ